MRATWRSIAYAGGGLALGYLGWQAVKERTEIHRSKGCADGKRLVVVGAGFGGMAVAAELARLLPDEGNGEIILVNEDNYLLFTPMLTEVAGGELDPRHAVSPARRISSRVRFVEARVKAIDLASKTVTLDAGANGPNSAEQALKAGHLVIALGSVTNFHNISGVSESALQMKTLSDAVAVCNRVLACLEQAALENDPAKRKELLTFVVAGGGYTGVETMAALNDLVRDTVSQYPKVEKADLRTVLIVPESRLLPELTSDLASYAEGKLRDRGVEIRVNTAVSLATEAYVEVGGKERIPARTLIWAAGVQPNPLVEHLPTEKSKHGAIKVNGYCQLLNHEDVWALGDCAEIPLADGKGTYAPTAQNATREGKLVARNIVAQLRGMALETFAYKPLGELALVGKHSGVARVLGLNFSGIVAWAMWRAVYLAKMPGLSQKARIVSDWLLDAVFGQDPVPLAWNNGQQNEKQEHKTQTLQAPG